MDIDCSVFISGYIWNEIKAGGRGKELGTENMEEYLNNLSRIINYFRTISCLCLLYNK